MIGQTLGHYRIESKLGEGGMGVVFKAHDLHLERAVALKILPPQAVENSERKQRFVHEARAASGLNHPNIIHIYDIGAADLDGHRVDFIAMEYVAGKTLAQLIAPRALRLSEALRYAVQIADALATAHAAGLVHRDIKPANIMVTDKDLVKVLDFGLAKLAQSGFTDSGGSDLTATLHLDHGLQTDEGVIMGTVAYMSPEQAEGKNLDGRSDIFSFGAVLYEMVTGQRAFRGETKLSTLAGIINQEPKPASQIVEGLPREVERIIALCLRKDPARRFQHMEDLKVALEDLKTESETGRLIAEPPSGTRGREEAARPAGARSHRKRVLAGAAVAAALLTAGGIYYAHRASRMLEVATTPDVRGGRLTLLASAENLADDPALSSDGKMLAYVAEDNGQIDLFVSRVAGGARVRLTNDPAREATPHISPDGERIVYTRYSADAPASEVRLVPTLGGVSVRLIANAGDAVWSPDGQRVAFISRRPGEGDTLATIAADGTDLRIVLRHDATYPFFRTPAWSPDGTKLAVVRSTGGIAGELWVVPLNGAAPRRLSNDGPAVFSLQPVFTADGRGIIHQSNRAGAPNLWVAAVDTGRLGRLTTGPGPDESPSVARDGSVAFANPRFRAKLFVYDLGTGQTRELAAHSSFIWAPAFSPDGREVAFSRAETDGSWHIWIAPLQGDTTRRLTSGAIPEIYSRFTPDGTSVIYHTWSPGHGRIWMEPRLGGPAVALTPVRDDDDSYGDISPDGRWLAFARTEKENTRIYVMPLKGGEAKRLTDSASTLPRWSPDGRWIVFSPSRGMSGGVFVMRADGSGVRRLTEAGSWPVWWPDGSRIGYSMVGPTGTEQIMTVAFEGGPPKPLSGLHFTGSNNPFDVSPDGKLLAGSDSVRLSSQIWLLK